MGISRLLWGSDIDVGRSRGYGVVSIHRVRGECRLRHGAEPECGPLAAGRARGARGDAAGCPGDTAALATTPAATRGTHVARLAEPLATRLADSAIRTVCQLAVRRIDLRVEGLEHLPATGPAILAARHFHHFYDGSALIAVVPRPLRILVTLDWLENPIGLRLMRRACQMASWPVVVRSDSQVRQGGARAARRQLLAATRKCVDLLRAGQVLVFPEGYPNIDPGFTPKADDGAFLPFESGFLRFAALAEQDGITRVPIVPVGLEYQRRDRWRVTVRFGHPVTRLADVDLRNQVSAIEEQVRRHPVWSVRPVVMRRRATSPIEVVLR